MSLIAVKFPYVLRIMPDEVCMNPREEYENIGKMICWHRNYNLGDRHDYDTPDYFLEKLVEEVVPEEELADCILEETDSDVLLGLARKYCCIMPVYLFDHSGLRISTEDLTKWPDGRWDAGQVGWIYANPESIIKEYGKYGPEEIKLAGSRLSGEVELYDNYLSGNCYGFDLFKEGAEDMSCWGFLGNLAEVKEDMAGYLPEECRELLDCLVEMPDTRPMRCEDYEKLWEEMEV